LLRKAGLAHCIEIPAPLQPAAELTDFGLFVQQDERAQGFLNDGAFGFDTGQFLSALDQGIIQDNVGAIGSLLSVCGIFISCVYYNQFKRIRLPD